ncbi:MAG TPA: DUF3500 domain-containing protein [Xanthobacteraceae bacterium]
MAKSDFRRFVPEMGTAPHFGKSTQQFFDAVIPDRGPKERAGVEKYLSTPFKGIITDGNVIPGLFALRSESAPTREILQAALALLAQLSPEQKEVVCLPLESRERELWQNSIARYERFGLRLDEAPEDLRRAAMAVVRASLSAAGYQKARNLMKLNAFLGELVGAPLVLGEWSYQLHIYGEPSATEPWGWQISGHHLIITCFVLGDQMTLTPTFMGAEPNRADAGKYAGIAAFEDEERLGLQFARDLSAEQRRKAIFSDSLLPDRLPPGRHQGVDGLMLSARQKNNTIIPYEGIRGADLAPQQRQSLLDLTQCYLSTLPAGPLAARMSDVERHFAATHFCWAGGLDDDSPFYYRIQSPVVMIEFDHQSGVVLKNPEPKKFHIHTIVRTPNGNDFGMDLLRLHYETAPHHQGAHHHHHHGPATSTRHRFERG